MTQPPPRLQTAAIDFPADGAPRSALYGDRYHPDAGAAAQARHVFLDGNGLPQRWAGRRRFVVLETGFGLGHNLLATWAAWDDSADATRPADARLVFVSFELHPATREDLARAHGDAPAGAARARADALLAAWPPATPGLHLIDLRHDLRLLLALGDARQLVPALRPVGADALFLDGFDPRRNAALWQPALLKALARHAALGATAATWSATRALREALTTAGFAATRSPGLPPKREMTRAVLVRPTVDRRSVAPAAAREGGAPREAVVVGGGVAGACAAAALARAGWRCTVLDAEAAPAAGASGNPAALFHGTVHADDGPHARFTRAAALHAARVWKGLIDLGVPGAVAGFVRAHAGADPGGWPADWAERLEGAALQARCAGLRADSGWWFPQGGWIAATAAVQALLATPGVRWQGGAAVAALRRDAPRAAWQLLGTDGRTLACAPVVVLACAAQAGSAATPLHALLAGAGAECPPIERRRGQVTWFAAAPGAARPAHPVSGHGYALALPDGRLLCGATTQRDDSLDGPAAPTEAEHAFNLQRLAALGGWAPAPGAGLHGRVGWREAAPDTLPVVGAAVRADAPTARRALRGSEVPRVEGLFLMSALAGRGFTWGPLAGELLAATVAGDPLPVEASLADALDPARWRVRASRRGPAAADA